MDKKWIYHDTPSSNLTSSLTESLKIDSQIANLLIHRGVETFEDAKTFFRPTLKDLHDPFLMKGMSKAVNRVCEAVYNKEKILIYGDYDVDGTTSVALLYLFLKEFVDSVDYYIPDRYTEGYGISEQGVHWARENGFTLIIALDCGIRAVDNAKLAKKLKVDLIVCDHHLPGDILPEAFAILDPKQPDCTYPFKELSGCGVGFKLLQGFCQQNTIDPVRLFEYLDLVAVSIASDIVPIVGENRILAFYGLKKLNLKPIAGLYSLMAVSGIVRPVTISDIVFSIGPRINAAGRLRHAKESVKVLISENENELAEFSEQLNQTNIDRRAFDVSTTEEALEMIEENDSYKLAKTTVLFKPGWHKGVVGIVASRCIETYYRPTIILTESNGKATGSARSVDGFDVHQAIMACEELLDEYGGHKYAAGVTMPKANVDAFRKKFEQVVTKHIHPDQLIPKLRIDLEVDFDFISFKNYSILKQMAPFGPGNLQPLLVSEHVSFKNSLSVLKEKHLKMRVYQEGKDGVFDAIAFGFAHMEPLLRKHAAFKMAYHLDENTYKGYKCLQLIVKDIKIGS